ncbi:LmbU family transcriptional regulator [Actinoplanes sp. NPDC089786]|uniref:LmbU family transcriptional regulator n=1 Tax=Actinoplanes sp. NPDC089786 TaxID=3155185 RepID=UPI00341A208C
MTTTARGLSAKAPAGTSRPVRDGRAVCTEEDGSPVLVTRVGLRIPGGLTYESWERAGQRLADVVDSSAWCLGDWLIHGEREYGDRYRRAVEAVGLEYQTLRNYAWVARRFTMDRRRPALSFQHHAEVAGQPDDEQDYWLSRAEESRWSRNKLRSHVKAKRRGGGESERQVSLPRIEAEQARLDRWRAAADRAACSLESWIIASLDTAAGIVLEEGRAGAVAV